MNLFLSLLPKLLQSLPTLIAGVEVLSKGKSGAEKKAAVMSMLPAAIGIADTAAPQHADAINAIAALASSTVDSVVTGLNQAGVFTKAAPAAVPAS